jgi:hypothetical protein
MKDKEEFRTPVSNYEITIFYEGERQGFFAYIDGSPFPFSGNHMHGTQSIRSLPTFKRMVEYVDKTQGKEKLIRLDRRYRKKLEQYAYQLTDAEMRQNALDEKAEDAEREKESRDDIESW